MKCCLCNKEIKSCEPIVVDSYTGDVYCDPLCAKNDFFGGDLGEVYCSHECVSLNRDNEEWTALNNPDEYLPWFPEKEGE